MTGSQGQLLCTERGRPMLCYGGYLYTKNRKIDHLAIWRCMRRTCLGSIAATPGGLVIENGACTDTLGLIECKSTCYMSLESADPHNFRCTAWKNRIFGKFVKNALFVVSIGKNYMHVSPFPLTLLFYRGGRIFGKFVKNALLVGSIGKNYMHASTFPLTLFFYQGGRLRGQNVTLL